ncbi:ABC transporter substrate-binding protein [uncultured Roseovarius sp.]|uniref:ABC transporter substrate-binding protein n=1 Tax=uncultured Roseovarius sp. TaxID=293344 RepID=UPI002626045B|nr:ABC transporter substrate-binding protein [uncultured Roseovarius sp.]
MKSSMTRRGFFGRTAAAGVGGAALLASMNSQASAADGEPIIVGCPSPLTGIVAADGIEFRRGLELAAEEINTIGGILGRPIQLEFVDTESKGDDVVSQAAQRLVDRNNASALITGYNLETGTVLPEISADAGVICMHAQTQVTHEEVIKSDPDRYWGSFMIDPPETFYADGLLEFIKELETKGKFDRPNDKLAIITGPGNYSVNIADTLNEKAKEYGFEVSLFETVKVPISEWGPTLSKLRADPPAVIAMTHYFPQDQAQFMLQFMDDPTDSLVYMQYGASLAAFRDVAGDASEGVLYATVIGALQDEIGIAFREAYAAKFGADASPNSGGQTYQALYMYAIAASLAGGVGAAYEEEQNRKVAERLRGLIFRGPMGTYRCVQETQSAYAYPAQTNDPSLGMPHIFSQIQSKAEDGKLVAPWPYIVADFQLPNWMKS